MNALIYTGGDWPEDTLVRRLVQQADDFICCDGAANRACSLGLPIRLLVGDMDSIQLSVFKSLQTQTPILRLPCEKDWTDLEMACNLAIERGADRVTIVGGLGGRMDHAMGNLQCLFALARRGVDAQMEGRDEVVRVLLKEGRILGAKGKTFSLVPLLPDTIVQRMEGAFYPLHHAALPLGCTLGISNVAVEDVVQIQIQQGAALLFIVREPV